MRVEIKRLQKKLGITTGICHHDQEVCFSIPDEVAVMNGGVIEQFGTPEKFTPGRKRSLSRGLSALRISSSCARPSQYLPGQRLLPFLAEMDCGKDECPGTIPVRTISRASRMRRPLATLSRLKSKSAPHLGKSYQYELSTPIGRLVVNDGLVRFLQSRRHDQNPAAGREDRIGLIPLNRAAGNPPRLKKPLASGEETVSSAKPPRKVIGFRSDSIREQADILRRKRK